MKLLMRLYIVGQTPSAKVALDSIQSLCDSPGNEHWEVEVVDVLKTPHLAEEDRIIAVPALVKKLPLPVRRYVGDLSDKDQVLLGLDLVIPDFPG